MLFLHKNYLDLVMLTFEKFNIFVVFEWKINRVHFEGPPFWAPSKWNWFWTGFQKYTYLKAKNCFKPRSMFLAREMTGPSFWTTFCPLVAKKGTTKNFQLPKNNPLINVHNPWNFQENLLSITKVTHWSVFSRCRDSPISREPQGYKEDFPKFSIDHFWSITIPTIDLNRKIDILKTLGPRPPEKLVESLLNINFHIYYE